MHNPFTVSYCNATALDMISVSIALIIVVAASAFVIGFIKAVLKEVFTK